MLGKQDENYHQGSLYVVIALYVHLHSPECFKCSLGIKAGAATKLLAHPDLSILTQICPYSEKIPLQEESPHVRAYSANRFVYKYMPGQLYYMLDTHISTTWCDVL